MSDTPDNNDDLEPVMPASGRREDEPGIDQISIEDELQSSYLDYAMSVIVARALPDARDGLKPVHRRILYAMYMNGFTPDKKYVKSSRTVGETMAKYHPHGDTAIYDAMVRMAQPFSMSLPLVDGQGNFGSVDGDPPAAMRYTESRWQNRPFRSSTRSMKILSDSRTITTAPNVNLWCCLRSIQTFWSMVLAGSP